MGAVVGVEVVTEAPVYVANDNTGGALRTVGVGVAVVAVAAAGVAVAVAVAGAVEAAGADS
jgi:hypothetical protein